MHDSPVSQQSNWTDFLGGLDSGQYSPLDQINRKNISRLKEAWRYEFPGNGISFGNPLVLDGRMYQPWSGGVVALDAASGRELWRRDAPGVYMRGLSSWTDPHDGSRRLFYTLNDRLYAIDAQDGQLIASFGEGGSIDLKKGLDRDPASISRIESQSPGRVFENLIILGSTGGFAWNAPSGDIRAYDVRTGEMVWKFHSVPRPGEPNFGTWPEDAWKVGGGPNNWSGMTIDSASGTLFIPFASARYNFYGANRPGDNLYANSLVALDARSGQYLWHFQTVHHDLWDYDLPQAPKLLTLNRDGEKIEAVAAAGKTGFVYTFERRSGQPVFPIEERPVPQSDVEGEHTSPTQPFPVAPPPFARRQFTIEHLSPYLSEEERHSLQDLVASLRNEGLFTPPSKQGTVTMPGTSGGTNWGSGVADPESGRLFIVSHEVPSILKLEQPSERTSANFFTLDLPPGESLYNRHCAACHGNDKTGQPPAIPSLVNSAEYLSIQAASTIIQRGRATMPGFSLSAEDLSSLLSYLGFELSSVESSELQSANPHREDSTNAGSPIRYKSGYNFFFSQSGLPANTPPWSMLTAYDMNKGEILWQIPYGQLPQMQDSGTIFPRGAIVGTAGGLLISGNQDRLLRAWDMDTGEELFATELPSIPAGVPAVYQIDGKQFIAVPAASYDPNIARMAPEGVIPAGRNSLVVYSLGDQLAQ